MPWAQSDIDALKTAIADGGTVKSVTFADQTMIFRSLDEMKDLLALMQQDATGGSRTRYAATSKGC